MQFLTLYCVVKILRDFSKKSRHLWTRTDVDKIIVWDLIATRLSQQMLTFSGKNLVTQQELYRNSSDLRLKDAVVVRPNLGKYCSRDLEENVATTQAIYLSKVLLKILWFPHQQSLGEILKLKEWQGDIVIVERSDLLKRTAEQSTRFISLRWHSCWLTIHQICTP